MEVQYKKSNVLLCKTLEPGVSCRGQPQEAKSALGTNRKKDTVQTLLRAANKLQTAIYHGFEMRMDLKTLESNNLPNRNAKR
jgi:hypothetical protein